jgi:PTS system nitrogen regulatory IIA component
VRLEKAVDFDAMDGEPVDLMIALFAPPEAGSEHLRALARVSRLLRRPEIREQLRQAQSADAILATLVQDVTPTAA